MAEGIPIILDVLSACYANIKMRAVSICWIWNVLDVMFSSRFASAPFLPVFSFSLMFWDFGVPKVAGHPSSAMIRTEVFSNDSVCLP